MGGYVGSAEDQRRIIRQQKERDEQRRQFEEAKQKLEAGGPGLRTFGTGTSEVLEHAFKTETVGLVTRDEFLEKRQTIAERLEAETRRQRDAEVEATWQERERQRAKRAKAEQKSKLSFQDDFEDDDEEEEEKEDTYSGRASKANTDQEGGKNHPAPPVTTASTAPVVTSRRFATLGKDPTVRSDFLPDRDREREEQDLREQLRKEWTTHQQTLKSEPLEITYSYWNGTGHRRTVTVQKGDTIATFLKVVQEQLAPQFREIRTCSGSSLMYVKEDMILPSTVTFYELIVKKAQGRSGPLFQFDLQETAVTKFDPRVKSQDSHAGKVVERHWYSRNKHIFPYNKWTVYDPDAVVGDGEGDAGNNGGK
jgi:protein FAM50